MNHIGGWRSGPRFWQCAQRDREMASKSPANVDLGVFEFRWRAAPSRREGTFSWLRVATVVSLFRHHGTFGSGVYSLRPVGLAEHAAFCPALLAAVAT